MTKRILSLKDEERLRNELMLLWDECDYNAEMVCILLGVGKPGPYEQLTKDRIYYYIVKFGLRPHGSRGRKKEGAIMSPRECERKFSMSRAELALQWERYNGNWTQFVEGLNSLQKPD